ncbi:MAG: FeoB-associated Cys-rich membrane protein [Eubacterium sp.]|nr:FeoB-associated Cys-rich membrane protein [Eubacterium sp.]MBR4241681.1 FeoB-associated Cys-rich membrane protein [Eubacterium sp.]MBR7060895.1 FeoB-associated Cys-rich membrane protein [Eubacterium sp.]
MPNIIITIITIAVIGLAVFLAIRKLVKDRKNGIGACGQKCANCPHSANCHH